MILELPNGQVSNQAAARRANSTEITSETGEKPENIVLRQQVIVLSRKSGCVWGELLHFAQKISNSPHAA